MWITKDISRRQFIYISALLSMSRPFSLAVASSPKNKEDKKAQFQTTIAVLTNAYEAEMLAHEHYVHYSKKAVEEAYPNIAYLFTAFSLSEKIHADNFKNIVNDLGSKIGELKREVVVQDTKTNLKNAAKKELIKIEKTYPDYHDRLETESHQRAMTTCIYSWKGHRQHQEKICEIDTYCKWFFGSLAKRIEGLKMDFHICQNCGSTIDELPKGACVICSIPFGSYKKVERPV
jgi:rubrerythrin